MSSFVFSCFRLFNEYPLVKFRTPKQDEKYDLNVLVIGKGSNIDIILKEILTSGQLLDTNLYLSIFTSAAASKPKKLLEKAPGLKEYVNISLQDKQVNVANQDQCYANMTYFPLDNEKLKKEIIQLKDKGNYYVIISTGNNEQNKMYAENLSTIFGEGSIIAYVQTNKTSDVIKSEAKVVAFGHQKEVTDLHELERIAYNLHYCYCKGDNPRATNESIMERFQEDYNNASNWEAAIHVKEKLECCGIDTTNLNVAAQQFSNLLKDQPAIINRLAAMEHRRWMMEKFLKGYTMVDTLDKIYSRSDVTTHDNKEMWHVCLVPCDETSQLDPWEWKKRRLTTSQLDPLDSISYEINKKCKVLSLEKKQLVYDHLNIINNLVNQIFEDETETLSAMRSLELSISQMYQRKYSVLHIYEGNLQSLYQACETTNSTLKESLKQELGLLNDYLRPLKEYISFKDYKEQDRLLIKTIPFALTHNKECTLIKLMSSKSTDSLYTTCQLETTRTIFVDLIHNHNEFLQFENQISNITGFLNQYSPGVKYEYHLILDEQLANQNSTNIKNPLIQFHVIDEINYSNVGTILKEISSHSNANYLDITNGNPFLMMCSNQLGIPLIAQSSGVMINVLNAPEVTYPSPGKTLTVQEMFSYSGTVLKKDSDSSTLSNLSSCYKNLFNIAFKNKWSQFCQFLSEQYKAQKYSVVLPTLNEKEPYAKKEISLNVHFANTLIPIFTRLEKDGYITELDVRSNLDDEKTFKFKVRGSKAGDKILDMIHDLSGYHTSITTYKLKYENASPEIQETNLKISNLKLPKESEQDFKTILEELRKNHILLDFQATLQKDEKGNDETVYSFQFLSEDIVDIIQNSGKVLECYIYYAALLDGDFDDIEMGWNFNHSTEKDTAENEIDVICTKGYSSLFISAKNVVKSNYTEGNYLNYIIYEISLLAEHFGINAKPVIAIPHVSQFTKNNSTNEYEFSKEVKAAYRRGVYLLGKECFNKDYLGEVLNRIAEGRDDWCDFLKSDN